MIGLNTKFNCVILLCLVLFLGIIFAKMNLNIYIRYIHLSFESRFLQPFPPSLNRVTLKQYILKYLLVYNTLRRLFFVNMCSFFHLPISIRVSNVFLTTQTSLFCSITFNLLLMNLKFTPNLIRRLVIVLRSDDILHKLIKLNACLICL